MATNEVRLEFKTREGVYRNIKTSQYCRPSRLTLSGKELQPVRLSFVSCKDQGGRLQEWIAFNSGKELYFYQFEGVGKPPDLRKHIDKRIYRLPYMPVCHDVNVMTRTATSLDLVVGFSTGQIQYINPIQKLTHLTFNDNPEIEESSVTCIKWVPGTENQFVTSHRSGHLYFWTTENMNKSVAPQMYIQHKEIQDTTIFTPKPRHRSSLVFKWKVGYGAINNFAFSPDSTHLAVANQDGFLRVYDFKNQTFHGRMRSYYGALLCVCWSPDGEFVATGGEDDQISVWSFRHQRVVVRGEGHRSYVNAVAFDPFTSVIPDRPPAGGEEEAHLCPGVDQPQTVQSHGTGTGDGSLGVQYRLGSVGQDGVICLWDLTDDVLRLRRLHSRGRSRFSKVLQSGSQPSSPSAQRKFAEGAPQDASHHVLGASLDEGKAAGLNINGSADVGRGASPKADNAGEGARGGSINGGNSSGPEPGKKPAEAGGKSAPTEGSSRSGSSNPQSDQEQAGGKVQPKKVKRKSNRLHKLKEQLNSAMRYATGNHGYSHHREVGTFETCKSDDVALKMHEVNNIEPLVAKYICQERLTDLVFLDDCIVTCSQEGFVDTWVRPDTPLPKECTVAAQKQQGSASPSHNSSGVSYDASPQRNPPGLNSPRPGEEQDALKQTTV